MLEFDKTEVSKQQLTFYINKDSLYYSNVIHFDFIWKRTYINKVVIKE